MTVRVALRKTLRNTRTLFLTSLGYTLYRLGSLLQGKPSKQERPSDPINGPLHDMQKYLDLSVARHSINYQILKDEAGDARQPYPTRDQYDRQTNFPSGYSAGDEIDTDELSLICKALNHDEATMVKLIHHNPTLVINYLHLRYWDYQNQKADA